MIFYSACSLHARPVSQENLAHHPCASCCSCRRAKLAGSAEARGRSAFALACGWQHLLKRAGAAGPTDDKASIFFASWPRARAWRCAFRVVANNQLLHRPHRRLKGVSMGLKWGGGCHPHRPAILQSWYSGTWVYFRARWSKGYPFNQKGSNLLAEW